MMVSTPPVTQPFDQSAQRVSSGEYRWVVGFAGLVMVMTLLPYLLGYAVQGQSWRFTGFVFGVEDGNSYIAKMMSGSAGAWLFRTPYTAESQQGVIAFLPYILSGKLATPPGLHEQLVAIFHLFRLVAGLLEILVTYHFIAYFIQSVSLRRAALVVATLGGGLGWLVALGGGSWFHELPLEFYSPESFGFLALFGLPHLALARAGLLYGLLAYLESLHAPTLSLRVAILKISISWLVVAFSQPLTAGIMGLVLCLIWLSFSVELWRQGNEDHTIQLNKIARNAWTLLAAGLLPGLFLTYTFLMFRTDPFLKGWTEQNIISSPAPLYYLMAYGMVLPFAFAGAIRLSKRLGSQGWLLILWVLLLPLLAYAPTNLQRRLPEGIWVAFSILAIAAFDDIGAMRPTRSVQAGWVMATLSLPSTLFLVMGGFMAASHPATPVFQPAEGVAAYEYLAKQAKPGEVVLAAYATGNALPAWAPLRVVIGHGPESVGLAELSNAVEEFFSVETPDADRRRLIESWKVDYIFHGPHEKELGLWDPASSVSLTRIYQTDGYEIYHVVR